MTKERDEKSKLKFFLEGKGHWKPNEPADYMKKLTRKQASTIFKARARMIKVKGNYKNGYPDQKCRACKDAPETQKHALYECKKLHLPAPAPNAGSTDEQKPDNKITPDYEKHDIFTEDPDMLKTIAKEIDNIIDILNDKPKDTILTVVDRC